MITNRKGFTLIELIVVMAVFIVVIVIAADSFNTIQKQGLKISKSEESNIEGIIGLEIFQHDIEQTGFGLPSSFSSTPPSYNEAADSPGSNFNDAPSDVPRPVIAGNDLASSTGILANTDYLVIKGTTLGRSPASQRWTYINYSSSTRPPHHWPSENLVSGDRTIVLKRSFSESGVTNQLVNSSSSNFYVNYSDNAFTGAYAPAVQNEVFTIYGVDRINLRMPFNRADYFITRPDSIPSRCAPDTGILYKTLVKQDDGKLSYFPVLDCVASMQVVFGWDINGDGLIDAYSDADGSNVSGATSAQIKAPGGVMGTAEGIRNSLKLIKVYILTQDGAKDPFYTNSAPNILVGAAGETNLTRSYPLSPEQMNYRWKVNRIIVRPKNLSTN